MALVPCPACRRHLRAENLACPFCGAAPPRAGGAFWKRPIAAPASTDVPVDAAPPSPPAPAYGAPPRPPSPPSPPQPQPPPPLRPAYGAPPPRPPAPAYGAPPPR